MLKRSLGGAKQQDREMHILNTFLAWHMSMVKVASPKTIFRPSLGIRKLPTKDLHRRRMPLPNSLPGGSESSRKCLNGRAIRFRKFHGSILNTGTSDRQEV